MLKKAILDLELKIKELQTKLTDEIALKERFKLNYESSHAKIKELETNVKVKEEVRICHCNQDHQRRIVSFIFIKLFYILV